MYWVGSNLNQNEERTEFCISVFLFVHNELICSVLQVNNAGASGVVVDEEGLRALNIDPSSWVILPITFLLIIHSDIFLTCLENYFQTHTHIYLFIYFEQYWMHHLYAFHSHHPHKKVLKYF